MLKIKNALLVLLMATVALSCNKKDDVTPDNATISGNWKLNRVTSDSQFANGDTEEVDDDFSNSDLYFDFEEDGTYTTNAYIELGVISEGDGTINNGTYSYANNELSLTYYDPFADTDVTLLLDTDINNSDLKLSIGLEGLRNSVQASSGSIDGLTRAVIQAYLGTITTFSLDLYLSITPM